MKYIFLLLLCSCASTHRNGLFNNNPSQETAQHNSGENFRRLFRGFGRGLSAMGQSMQNSANQPSNRTNLTCTPNYIGGMNCSN